jgi:hypothetical protein
VGIVGDTALGRDLVNDCAIIMVENLDYVNDVVALPQHVNPDFVGAATHTEERRGTIDHVEAVASSELL